MGTSLNGLTPAGTYPGLIKTGDNAPIDGTLKTLSDGNGNNLPMSVSTTTINLTGTAQVGGVAIANTTQLAAKQDTLVSGTNIKTVNSTSLLGSGNVAVQDVLVSGTNIKTINGTSVLGSGNIVTPSTNPSGVSGAIQFSNGSAFASDAANLFWDDINNRLGIGTNAPTATTHIKGSGSTSATTSLLVQNSGGTQLGYVDDSGQWQIGTGTNGGYKLDVNGTALIRSQLRVESTSTFTQTLTVSGGNLTVSSMGGSGQAFTWVNDNGTILRNSVWNYGFSSQNTWLNGSDVASSIFTMNTTTKGFLPPRMTTAQKNAIATPAAGLMVYDTTLNKLCCYNGSTWNDLF